MVTLNWDRRVVPLVDQIMERVKDDALTRHMVEFAIREGVTSKTFVRVLALIVRDGIDTEALDVDRHWKTLLDAEAGKLDKRWAKLFAKIRRKMKAKAPKPKVARKPSKR